MSMPIYLMFIKGVPLGRVWVRTQNVPQRGALFYNASAFRPCGRDLAEFFKSTGWALYVVRRDSAVKLVDDLASESLASASCPVGTVVISGDGKGDQAVESREVNALDGWTQVWSASTVGLAKQQVVAKANCS